MACREMSRLSRWGGGQPPSCRRILAQNVAQLRILPEVAAAMYNRQSVTISRYAVQFDGPDAVNYVKRVDGGFLEASQGTDPSSHSLFQMKQLTSVEVKPMEVQFGASSATGIIAWIQSSWLLRNSLSRSGNILYADANYKVIFEHQFFDAFIQETTFPALDTSSKEPAYVKVKLQPRATKFARATDSAALQPSAPKKQTEFRTNQFRFGIDGVPLSHVYKISEFSIRQQVKAFRYGSERLAELTPSKLEFPDLRISMSLQYADPILAWYEFAMAHGLRDNVNERTGFLEMLSPEGKPLLRLVLHGMGLKSVNIGSSESGSDTVRRLEFSVYVTSIIMENVV